VLALLNLGPGEIVLLLVLGVVLFGRDLPGVGRRVGRVVANLRRSMNDFKRQLDADESIREIRNSMQDTRRDLEQATRVPRAVANPTGALRQFATEALEQDLPEDRVTP
jgi:Sec-independent protein translocase protein TatA